MRRRFAGALVGALVAGSMWMAAAPAQAGGVTCELGDPPQETLIDTSGPIQIYAGRVPGYALALAGWITNYADCVHGNVMVTVNCVQQAGPVLPLVEVDTETLTITIYDDNILGDPACLFSS